MRLSSSGSGSGYRVVAPGVRPGWYPDSEMNPGPVSVCLQKGPLIAGSGERDAGACGCFTLCCPGSENKMAAKSVMLPIRHLVNPGVVMFGSSPRIKMYGNEFGLGKAAAVLSGHDNNFDGKGTLYPGHQGGESIDVDLCLYLHSMSALEKDDEFLDALNFS
ncbi:hypothetical protein AgCh_006939 [Apium graveolens]